MTEELVFKSEKGNPITTSRLIAKKFNKRHSDVMRAIDNLELSSEFRQRNFALVSINNLENPSPIVKEEKHYLMTKDGFTLIVMGFTGTEALKFKVDFINAFNKMEEKLKSFQLPDFSNPAIAARAWADEAEKKMIAEARVKHLQPKADFADRITATSELVDIGQVSKVLELPFGRNTTFKKLREKGVLFKNRNEPKQQYVNQGYFKLKTILIERNNNPDITKLKVFVTPKGLSFLSKVFQSTPTQANLALT